MRKIKKYHPLYNSWNWMRRMEVKFTVCSEWKDFWRYVEDMGERPSPLHQIHRVDKTRGYDKDNCQWKETTPNQDKSQYAKQWRSENPEKCKGYDVKKLGITLEEYKALLRVQGNSCAVCSKSEKEEGRALAIDHCHETKKIRGLLCTNCNTGLGNFKDDVDKLRSAIEYLDKHKL